MLIEFSIANVSMLSGWKSEKFEKSVLSPQKVNEPNPCLTVPPVMNLPYLSSTEGVHGPKKPALE